MIFEVSTISHNWDLLKLAWSWSCKQSRLLSLNDLWNFGNPDYLQCQNAGENGPKYLDIKDNIWPVATIVACAFI